MTKNRVVGVIGLGHVEKGELLAQAAEGLSANIHASISGVVEEITEKGARIRGRKE